MTRLLQTVPANEGADGAGKKRLAADPMIKVGKITKAPYHQPGILVAPMTTSNVFKAGHQLRIEISSSNFPRFSRNLNTGGANHDEKEPRVARNVVHFGGEQASRVELTVLP